MEKGFDQRQNHFYLVPESHPDLLHLYIIFVRTGNEEGFFKSTSRNQADCHKCT